MSAGSNRMFKTNESQFYKELKGASKKENVSLFLVKSP